MNEEWDPDNEIEKILRHRHTRYVRRPPGKDTYGPNALQVTTKKIRLLVRFFRGTKQWIPVEAARNDNPLPLVDYAVKMKLTKRPEWEWVEEFDLEEFEDLRRAFISKFENTPKYKFGVQMPASISHALRLDKLNGNQL
jgi:hypothetical protein